MFFRSLGFNCCRDKRSYPATLSPCSSRRQHRGRRFILQLLIFPIPEPPSTLDLLLLSPLTALPRPLYLYSSTPLQSGQPLPNPRIPSCSLCCHSSPPTTTMAAQFIGLTVLLTLSDPGHTKLRGLVADVNGPQLSLRDGKSLSGTVV